MNIQTSSIGLSSEGRHLPLIEDQVDGDVRFRMRSVAVTRKDLDSLFSNPADFLPFDNFSLKVSVQNSPRKPAQPGTIQARVRADVNLLNVTLNSIISDLGLSEPPSIIQYDRMRMRLEVEQGRVKSGHDVLHLEGVKILSFGAPIVAGDVRVHLAGQSFPLRGLVYLGQRLADSQRSLVRMTENWDPTPNSQNHLP